MTELTHFNAKGDAHMVDIGAKAITRRIAVAGGEMLMRANTLAMITGGNHKKGDVLGIARIAGIMAAKKTAELIPLCHPIGLTHVEVDFTVDKQRSTVSCKACAVTHGQTGVEMEALNAVQVALLTIYDMCKAVDRAMVINSVRLLEKSGGKSGDYKVTQAK